MVGYGLAAMIIRMKQAATKRGETYMGHEGQGFCSKGKRTGTVPSHP
jgi:hypothetical protein